MLRLRAERFLGFALLPSLVPELGPTFVARKDEGQNDTFPCRRRQVSLDNTIHPITCELILRSAERRLTSVPEHSLSTSTFWPFAVPWLRDFADIPFPDRYDPTIGVSLYFKQTRSYVRADALVT